MSHKTHHLRLLIVIILMIASMAVGVLAGFFIFTTPQKITPPTPLVTTPPPPTVQTVDFIAVGDIMLSRNVARHAEKSGKPNWIWENIAPFLRSTDFVVGNLE